MFGVYHTSGTTFFQELGIYFVVLLAFYALMATKPVQKFLANRLRFIGHRKLNFNINYLIIGVLGFIIFHFFYLGGSPALQSLDIYYVEDVALLRESISKETPKVILYLVSFSMKAILPFLLLYLIIKKRFVLYWILLTITVFYSFSLMQKSYVVGLLLPSIIYCVMNRRILWAIKDVGMIVLVVVSLVVISNPPGGNRTNLNPSSVRINLPLAENVEPDLPLKEYSKIELIARGLYSRILIVPGEMVSGWFETIPAKKPFLYGDGYRVLAKIRGREYRDYSSELYLVLNPEYKESGLEGTVNVASFMYDYANFGWPGFILSGFLLAFLLTVVELFFADNFKLKLSINLFPILLLSSTAITTLLFSGGWGLSILLYYIFLQDKRE